MENQRKRTDSSTDLLTDMLLKSNPSGMSTTSDLVSEPSEPVADSFTQELEKSLSETEAEAVRVAGDSEDHQAATWAVARQMVQRFQPVPWFIWRLNNFVLGRPGEVNPVSEGLVLGLRRLLFAAASDPFFTDRSKVNNLKVALEVLPSDVIAAVSVIHAICRRLAACQFERIWRPVLDDALLRAQIGYLVGSKNPSFGGGRGMLAGFAGRSGLTVLIAGGDLDQARRALELLATGADIGQVGLTIYGCDPLQVSAMILSASGCGRDAASGTVGYAVNSHSIVADTPAQLNWFAAFSIVELSRMGRDSEIDIGLWNALGYNLGDDRGKFIDRTKTMIRRGHTLSWIV